MVTKFIRGIHLCINIYSRSELESYEQIMKDQFSNMKKSYIKLIKEANDEVKTLKTHAKKKILDLEEELEKANHLKDLFLMQLSDYNQIFGDIR